MWLRSVPGRRAAVGPNGHLVVRTAAFATRVGDRKRPPALPGDTVDAGRFEEAEDLARALFLLVEGAIVTALVLSAPAAARHAKRTAKRLIATHRRAVH